MLQSTITSLQNPKIKQLFQLQQKSSERRRQGCYVVEGARELSHCISARHTIDTVFYSETADPSVVENLPNTANLYRVSSQVYNKIAYRGSTEGVIAIVKPRQTTLDSFRMPQNPLFVVLESVEKPGNLGAVLRSADAAGVDAVIVCDPLTDIYNPNVIRSSIGALFSVPCICCTSEECIAWLKKHSVQILTAQLQDSELYYNTPMTSATAIVMGTEATGLTPIWREAADAHIRIPMLGRLDSLNVSVSAAILMYEAVRQRKS